MDCYLQCESLAYSFWYPPEMFKWTKPISKKAMPIVGYQLLWTADPEKLLPCFFQNIGIFQSWKIHIITLRERQGDENEKYLQCIPYDCLSFRDDKGLIYMNGKFIIIYLCSFIYKSKSKFSRIYKKTNL